MSGLDEVKAERLKKLSILTEKGINPYPAKTKRTHAISNVLTSFQALEREGSFITIAGRVMIVRGQGAILFVDMHDGTGKLQAVFKEDEIDVESFTLFKDVIDAGDFIEVIGTVFYNTTWGTVDFGTDMGDALEESSSSS